MHRAENSRVERNMQSNAVTQTENLTAAIQRIDANHHWHPFTDTAALNRKGARVIVRGEGVYVWDSEGNRIIDGMAGLWCVNMVYGRR